MLIRLTIQNYALIKNLEMDPSGSLNVITGETGAGKSIMLGAIGLLMGNRADTKVLWNDHEKCVIEGVFNIGPYPLRPLFQSENLDYEEETIFRREISQSGKSRAFINDIPVTLDVMKKIAGMLLDIHSQHETLDLGNRSFQLDLVDTFAGNQSLKIEYQNTWEEFCRARKNYEDKLKEAEALKAESDFVLFQLNELTQANFQTGEQELLESQLKVLEHAEDIKTRFNQIVEQSKNSEHAIGSVLKSIMSDLSAVSEYSSTYAKLTDRLNSVKIEFEDIIDEVENEEGKIEFDPAKTEEIKDRLSALYQLMQKHRVNQLDDLLNIQTALEQKANKTLSLDEDILKAQEYLRDTEASLKTKAVALSQSRQSVFKELCKKITTLLNGLGIPDAILKVDHRSTDPGMTGTDFIELLFSANKGIEAKPLGSVASGGEFSRLMFCVKFTLAEKTKLPTLILDEIDNGVSGEIALQLGKMMKRMATQHQIITITHLPQIAAKGESHYYVYKDNRSLTTNTQIRKLNEGERIAEIAQMIGGAKPSELALENARELIAD